MSVAKQLVRKDLKSGEPCGQPGCVLDLLSGTDKVGELAQRGSCIMGYIQTKFTVGQISAIFMDLAHCEKKTGKVNSTFS